MTTVQQDTTGPPRHLAVLVTSEMVRYAPSSSGGESSYTLPSSPEFHPVVERSGDSWLVQDPLTGIFGRGDDVLDAARDFRRAVQEHLDVLERQPELSEDLALQLDYLRARVRR